MHAAVLAFSAAATLLQAQEPAPRPSQAVLVDAVVATVNDSAIMLSELRTAAAGHIRTAMVRAGQLNSREIEIIFGRALDELINEHSMAQAAKTFGVFTPEQIEVFVQRELARQAQEQMRDLTYPEFSSELKRQGRTWLTFQSEQRVDIMARFAKEFAVFMRLQKQSNLYLTPRMLRETYERELPRFVHEAAARMWIVVFRGSDARTTAEQAATLWREQDLDGQQLAGRFPGAVALEVAADSLAPGLAAIATFALAGPVGSVSPPIESDGAVRIAKITAHRPARNGQFQDPAVQDELRNLCQDGVLEEFLQQALERARLRTEVWRHTRQK